jgi:hypothetical protein
MRAGLIIVVTLRWSAPPIAHASVDRLVVALADGGGRPAARAPRPPRPDRSGRCLAADGYLVALSVAVMIVAGARLSRSPSTSSTRAWWPGIATAGHRLRLPRRRTDVLTRQRAEALASRVARAAPITAGVLRLVLEQLAWSQLLSRLDVIVRQLPHALRRRRARRSSWRGAGPPRTATPSACRQRAEERNRHHRNRQHDPPAGGSALTRHVICRDIECARSPERSRRVASPAEHRPGRRPDVVEAMIRDATVLVIAGTGQAPLYERRLSSGAGRGGRRTGSLVRGARHRRRGAACAPSAETPTTMPPHADAVNGPRPTRRHALPPSGRTT